MNKRYDSVRRIRLRKRSIGGVCSNTIALIFTIFLVCAGIFFGFVIYIYFST